MKNVILMKKKWYLGLTFHLRTKTLEDLRKKTKKILDWIGRGEKVRKSI